MAGNQFYPPQSAPPPEYAPPHGYASEIYPHPQRPPASNVIHVVEPQPMAMTTGQDHVPNNIVLSILSIFCCPICGIIATYMANSANNSKYKPGGLEKAKRDAATAKKMAIVGIIVGILIDIIVLTLIFTVGGIVVAKTVDASKERVKVTDLRGSSFTTKRPPIIDGFFDN